MKIVQALPEPVWREYIDRQPQSNIFHTPEMFQVFSLAKGHHPELWAALGEDGRPLTLFLPVLVSIAKKPFQRMTSRSVAYGSILADSGERGWVAVASLLEAYKQSAKKITLFTELRNLSDLGVLQPVLQDHGFAYAEDCNFLISLERSREDLLRSFGKNTRKNVRRALRNKLLAVEEVNDIRKVTACYDLLKMSYARARVFLADRSLFEAAFQILHPRRMVRFLLVRLGSTYIASSVELIFNKTIYGWYCGMNRAFSKYLSNELITWNILEWGINNGYKTYDFGGIGSPEQKYGVRDFKAKFGGSLVCFGRNTHIHSPGLLRLSKLGYKIYRNMLALR